MINRVLTTRLSDLHFAPTDISCENLLNEGVPHNRVFITGNTVIDALLHVKALVEAVPPVIHGIPDGTLHSNTRMILITGHRRENFGSGFESMCHAIATLSVDYPDHLFIYPVHLNPNVREPVFRILGKKPNVLLIEPLDYIQFVYLMSRAYIILTDSGGVQEEAPSLGKPVLVMRDTTERPEGINAGTVKLVGNNAETIVKEVRQLLNCAESYQAMANRANPYGDGTSSKAISGILNRFFYS
jgi:UDP-N-acetylglucosamine 2-epimerase (non-hydrolysing)